VEKAKKYGKPPCLFKVNITEQEFIFLTRNFEHSGDWSQAIYLYFDSSSDQDQARLFGRHLRLRVRLKYGNYSLELKNQVAGDRWELTQPISSEEFRLIFQGVLPAGEISQRLAELNFSLPLKWIGTTQTTRKKVHFQDGVLVLDQTDCCNKAKTFYQVEFRSSADHLPGKVEKIKEKLNVFMRRYISKEDEIWD